MAQTQGTKRKVCYYYDGEYSPRAGGGGGAGPGQAGSRRRSREDPRGGG